jgi:hypothetical protein
MSSIESNGESSLSLKNSEGFRNALISRNLNPYTVDGAFSSNEPKGSFFASLSDRSPNNLDDISQGLFDEAKEATIVNVYGSPQGRVDAGELIGKAGSVSMQQAGTGNLQVKTGEQQVEYSSSYTKLELISEFYIDAAEVINTFIPDDGYGNSYISTEYIKPKSGTKTAEYPNFTISQEGLLGLPPGTFNLTGLNTEIANPSDSYLAQLSANFLAESFRERISREIEKNTIGRVNLQAFSDPFSVSLLASGQQPLIAKNYTITVPDGVVDQAVFLLQKFSGTYIPTSPIEGAYLTDPQRENTKPFQRLLNPINKSTSPFQPIGVDSTKFLNNTGSGQKSFLFTSLGYNKFKPNYNENKTQVGLAIDNIFGKDNEIGNYYVGSETSDPSIINSPESLVPLDEFGNKTHTIVFGPDVLGKEYEDKENLLLSTFKFGLSSEAYIDDQDPTGGFTWISTNTTGDAGKLVGPENDMSFGVSENFDGNIESKFNRSLSNTLTFKKGSILDDTQRIIDSAPKKGADRLKHVGNAINQVSKVFNDGYKEMTKGSKVKKYVNKNGVEVGQEYGRVFAKDIPYMKYSNLQQTVANDSGLDQNGNIRKFTSSILDSTYNLNIAPTAGEGSTNIKDGKVKKYMFSLENLAWRGTPEYDALPECEKGPNGGRIMWFPPYDISLGQESSTPTFNENNFLGRPEPIFTYEKTTRTGSISWSIIVDHPSVSNIIVKKELERADGNLATQVLASFFAGLKKYDIYELAKKYSTLSRDTIEEAYQQILQNPNSTTDAIKQTMNEAGITSPPAESSEATDVFSSFINYSFFFPYTSTGAESTTNYTTIYEEYSSDYEYYVNQNAESEVFFSLVFDENYNKMVELREQVAEILTNDKGTVELTFNGTRIMGAVDNSSLSSRWFDSIKLFFTEYTLTNNKKIEEYVDKTIIFKSSDLGTVTESTFTTSISTGEPFDCTVATGDTQFSLNAIACRTVSISNITVTPPKPTEASGAETTNNIPNPDANFGLKPKENRTIDTQLKGISKKILRELLTEKDYFEVIKSSDNFLYDSIKDKFKFFNPAFHSITPEGLNSRLVFLNQCVRPGRTIPTKKSADNAEINDAYNTNFGTPPILVLRFGDFYHTKIVPGSLSFTYENIWDFNPEGIGFQPMIAKVSLSFNMIGGHGLSGPVEKLQNALSFNYYANTEMYDERAEATEDTTALDKALIDSIRNEEPLVTINNVNDVNENEGGKILGNIVNSTPSENGVQSGTSEYKAFFNGFIEETQKYFTTITNIYESFIKEYNLGLWLQVNHDRYYNLGYADNIVLPEQISVPILGKQGNWEVYIGVCGQQLKNAIDETNVDLMDSFSIELDKVQYLTPSVKNMIKTNYKSKIDEVINNNFSSVAQYIQQGVETQLGLVNYMQKMDLVASGADGKIMADNSPKVYVLTGQVDGINNTLNEFQIDYTKIYNDITSFESFWSETIFVTSTQTEGLDVTLYNPYVGFSAGFDKYAYILFSNIILKSENIPTFVDDFCKNVQEEYLESSKEFVTDFITYFWEPEFSEEKYEEEVRFTNKKNETTSKTFETYNPQIDGFSINNRERVMDFVTSGETASQKTAIKDIYSTTNTNNDITIYNGKKQFNN